MTKIGTPATRRPASRAWRLARVRRGRTWAQRKAASKTCTLGKVA